MVKKIDDTKDDAMDDTVEDAMVVQTREGRRTLLREGAALLLAGTASSLSGNVLADDCDRAAGGRSKEEVAGSDSDSGDEADRPGCGKGAAQISSVINKNTPTVAKVKG